MGRNFPAFELAGKKSPDLVFSNVDWYEYAEACNNELARGPISATLRLHGNTAPFEEISRQWRGVDNTRVVSRAELFGLKSGSGLNLTKISGLIRA